MKQQLFLVLGALLLCFLKAADQKPEDLDDIIESEMDEGQQAVYDPEGPIETMTAAPEDDSMIVESILSVIEKAVKDDFAIPVSIADFDLSLWEMLDTKESEGALNQEQREAIQSFASVLEQRETLDDCAYRASLNCRRKATELGEIETRLAAHRRAFTMTLKPGEEAPTEKIPHFPRIVIANPDDKDDMDEDRAQEMEDEAYEHRYCLASMARYHLAQHTFSCTSKLLGELLSPMAGMLKSVVNGEALNISKRLIDTFDVDWDGEEMYRMKRKSELGPSLIKMHITSYDYNWGLEYFKDKNTILFAWDILDTKVDVPKMTLSETSACTLLYSQVQPLGSFETVGNERYLRLGAKRNLRRVIFSQFITAMATGCTHIVVYLRPFVRLGLSPRSIIDIYDYYRRMFSDIQSMCNYRIEEVLLCDVPDHYE